MSLPTAECIVPTSNTNFCSIWNSEGNFKGFNTELCFPFAQSDNKYQPLVSLEVEVTVHCRTIIRYPPGYHYPVSQCSNFKLHCFGIIFIHEIFYWRRNFSLFLFSKSSSLENVIFWNLFPHWVEVFVISMLKVWYENDSLR